MHERETWKVGSGGVRRSQGDQIASFEEGAAPETAPMKFDAEATLRHSIAVASALDPIITIDSHGVIQWAGDAVERVFGWSPQEITGKNVSVLMPEPHRSAHDGYLARHRETGRTNIIGRPREFEAVRKDGSLFPIELSVTRVDLPGEPLPYFTAIIRDISERKRVEREKELLRSLAIGIGEARDLDDAVAFTIRRICEETGWTCGEAWTADPDGENPRQLTIWCSTAPRESSLEPALRAAAPIVERRFAESLPGRVWSSKRPEWIPDLAAMRRGRFLRTDLINKCGMRGALAIPILADESVVAVLMFFLRAPREHDRHLEELVGAAVTPLGQAIRRRRVEDALFESQRQFREILENVDLLAVVMDKDGEITFYNDALLNLVDRRREEVLGQNWFEIFIPTDQQEAIGDLFRRGVHLREIEKRHENDIVTSSGERRRIRWSNCLNFDRDGRVAGATGVGVDITEQRRDEDERERRREELERLVLERTEELETTHDQLRVADRLAVIGSLAAGLGHDMNNVLFALRCRLDAVEMAHMHDAAHEDVSAIRGSVEYLQQLTDGLHLMALDAGDEEASTACVELKEWWERMAPLLLRSVPDHCAFEADIPAVPVSVAVPPHRLTQAVLNLVLNAAEAVDTNGRIRLCAESLEGGRLVRISVADNGVGMNEEVRRRCLDPFFTTKKRGRGTGLGLALVQGIAQAAGGSVEVDSRPGAGTTIALILPVTVDEAPSPEHEPAQAAITIEDKRTASLISALLVAHGLLVRRHDGSAPDECAVWVTESRKERLDEARRFLASNDASESPSNRRVIAVGPSSPEWIRLGALRVENPDDFDQLRRAVESAADAVQEPST
ncbi:MAG: PAS domain S-box protein [Phycisphaeraceae bacterium]|nr:MAG: PAS domain S-box protein [Phycisphaeraceae bacterium]